METKAAWEDMTGAANVVQKGEERVEANDSPCANREGNQFEWSGHVRGCRTDSGVGKCGC